MGPPLQKILNSFENNIRDTILGRRLGVPVGRRVPLPQVGVVIVKIRGNIAGISSLIRYGPGRLVIIACAAAGHCQQGSQNQPDEHGHDFLQRRTSVTFPLRTDVRIPIGIGIPVPQGGITMVKRGRHIRDGGITFCRTLLVSSGGAASGEEQEHHPDP